jgi:hypothetical protein
VREEEIGEKGALAKAGLSNFCKRVRNQNEPQRRTGEREFPQFGKGGLRFEPNFFEGFTVGKAGWPD